MAKSTENDEPSTAPTGEFSEVPRLRSLSPSLRAAPTSIRTLRPMSRTDQPPPEEAPSSPRARSRLRWAALSGGALVAALGVGAWALHMRSGHRRSTPVLLVNGAPALKQTPAGVVERWAGQSELTVQVDSSVDGIGPGAHDAVIGAFGTWLGSGASIPKLRFDTTTGVGCATQPDGKNVVTFAPIDLPGHKNDLAITVAFADDATGEIVEADIILNSEKTFGVVSDAEGHDDGAKPDCDGEYDVQNVATHEAGHFFGLGEDMTEHAATMFYKTGKCEIEKRQLKPSDSGALSGLYASRPAPPQEQQPGGCAVAESGSPRSEWGEALGLAVVCVYLARRRVG